MLGRAGLVRRGALRWGIFLLVVDASVGLLALELWRGEPSLGGVARVLAVGLLWAACSLAVVAGLYLWAFRGRNPGFVLRGDRARGLQVVFLPYRVVACVVFAAARVVRRGPVASEVAPGLYVGARPFPHEAGSLAAAGVGAVLDLAAELPAHGVLGRAPFELLELPVLDRTAPDGCDLERAVDWVRARRAQGRGVLVHCAFGRGRSALVACAVVLADGVVDSPEAALARVAAGRREVKLHADQFAALRAFHRGRAGRPGQGGGDGL